MSALLDAGLSLFMEAAASEEQGRVEVKGTPAEQISEAMRAELAPKFQAIWDADNPREYMRMGRRVGKSHYLIRKQAAKAAQGNPESINPFILPTFKSATMAIWPLAKRIVLRHFPEARTDETMKIITLPTGARLVYGGCETMADVGRWYSMAFEIAIVDERGNFPDSVLVELDDEALEPALMDYGGVFSGSGNPGRVLRGRWYDQSKDGVRSDPTPIYVGDARENPYLGQPAAAYFEAVKKRHGWTDQSPTFRRQYLGDWVEDSEGLVFPLTAANVIDALPLTSRAGGALPASMWRYVIGVDVGVVDATAIAVVAGHPLDNREFVVSAEKHSNWITGQLAVRLRELRKQYPYAPIVLDTGGMGKLHAEELTRRFQLSIEAAEKREKESAIRTTRDMVISERVVLLDGPCCDVLRDEWSVLGFDEDKRGLEDGMPDDATHAVVYAFRRLRHYSTTEAAPELPPVQALAKQLRDRRIAQLRPQPGRERWDR
jgi:hypothetical protein